MEIRTATQLHDRLQALGLRLHDSLAHRDRHGPAWITCATHVCTELRAMWLFAEQLQETVR